MRTSSNQLQDQSVALNLIHHRKLRQAQRAAQQDPVYAVNVEALTAAQPKDLDASEIEVRLGGFWHTQGSGKSLSMVFYAHLLQEALDSPTTVSYTHLDVYKRQVYNL